MKAISLFYKDLGGIVLEAGQAYDVQLITTTDYGTYISLAGCMLDAYNHMKFGSDEFAGHDGKPASYLNVKATGGKAQAVFGSVMLRIHHLIRAKGICNVRVCRADVSKETQTREMTRLFPLSEFEPACASKLISCK